MRIFLLLSIFLQAYFLRFFRFSEFLTINADYGMAYLLADRVINEKFLPLVGPVSAFGEQININPPLYYYLISFLYWIFKTDTGVTTFFAAVGIITVYLIYLLGREADSVKTGLFAAFFYSTSFLMVTYDRNIWEPYRLPFFIALAVYFLFLAVRKKSAGLIIISAVSYSFSLMYITSILLAPAYLTFLILNYKKIRPNTGIKPALFAFFIPIIILYIPVFLFEAGHNFPSLIALSRENAEFIKLSPSNILSTVFVHLKLFIESVFLSKNYFSHIIIFSLLTAAIIALGKGWPRKNKNIHILLTMFLSALFLTGIYSSQKELYAWRLAPIYPIFFILFSYFINANLHTKEGSSGAKKAIFMIFTVILSVAYIWKNIQPLASEFALINKEKYGNFIKVAKYISDSSEGENYSIFVITADNYYSGHTIPYYYAILKITGKNKANYNESGNWVKVSPDSNSGITYLICSNNIIMSYVSDYECLRRFIKMRKTGRNEYSEKKQLPNHTVYKIIAEPK